MAKMTLKFLPKNDIQQLFRIVALLGVFSGLFLLNFACHNSKMTLLSVTSISATDWSINANICVGGGGTSGGGHTGAAGNTLHLLFDIYSSPRPSGVCSAPACFPVTFAPVGGYPASISSGQESLARTGPATAYHGIPCNLLLWPYCLYGPGPCEGGSETIIPCKNGPNTCVFYSSSTPSPNRDCLLGIYSDRYYAMTGGGTGPATSYCVNITLQLTSPCGCLADSIEISLHENGGGLNSVCINGADNPKDWLLDFTPFLPVEWGFVEATGKENGILVTWGTLTEINNEKFIVEKSSGSELNDFSALAEIASMGSQRGFDGYSFLDKNPINGLNTYRITQIDFNGKSSHSEIVQVNYEGILPAHINNISPVPVLDITTVEFYSPAAKTYNVKVVDVTGRVFYSQVFSAVAGKNSCQLDLSGYGSGIYFVNFSNGPDILNGKILKK